MDVMKNVTAEEVMRSIEVSRMRNMDGYSVAKAATSGGVSAMVWAAYASTEPDTLRFLAAREEDIVRSATARNKHTPSDAIDSLFNDTVFRVVRALASNSSVPVSKLVDIWHRNMKANDAETAATMESLINQEKFPTNVLEDFVWDYRTDDTKDIHHFTATKAVEEIVSKRELSENLYKAIFREKAEKDLYITSCLITNPRVSMKLIIENIPQETLPQYSNALSSREQDIRDYLSSETQDADYSHLPKEMIYSIIGMR